MPREFRAIDEVAADAYADAKRALLAARKVEQVPVLCAEWERLVLALRTVRMTDLDLHFPAEWDNPSSERHALFKARELLAKDWPEADVAACGIDARIQAVCAPGNAAAATPPDEELTAKVRDLAAACKVGLHEAVAARTSATTGNGLVAAAGIGRGEAVVRVPKEQLVNVFAALRDQDFCAQELLRDFPADTVLLVYLLFLRAQHAADGRHPGLFALCPEFSNVALWTAEEQQCLGPVLGEHLAQVEAQLHDTAARLAAFTAAKLPPCAAADLRWAQCFVDSRAFCVQARPFGGIGFRVERTGIALVLAWGECVVPRDVTCLAPIADQLNHHFCGQLATPAYEDGALVLRTGCPVAAGAEICLNYGPLQTWEQLCYYGFADAPNPYDRITLSFEPEDAAQALVMAHADAPTEVCFRRSGPLPPKLGVLVEVLGLDPACLGEALEAAVPDTAVGRARTYVDAQRQIVAANLERLRAKRPAEARDASPAKRPRVEGAAAA